MNDVANERILVILGLYETAFIVNDHDAIIRYYHHSFKRMVKFYNGAVGNE